MKLDNNIVNYAFSLLNSIRRRNIKIVTQSNMISLVGIDEDQLVQPLWRCQSNRHKSKKRQS